MIDVDNEVRDLGAQIPSQKRHKCLEQPKMKGETEVMSVRRLWNAATDGDGDSERIHRQSYGDSNDGQQVQIGNSLFAGSKVVIRLDYSTAVAKIIS